MQYRFLAAQVKRYDHDACFDKYRFIDWAPHANLFIGDIVYIYFALPIKRVRYKTIVERIITDESLIKGDEFWINGYERKKSKCYYRLKMLQKTEDERLSYENLLNHGVVGTLQGCPRVKSETLKYIESIFENESEDIKLSEEFEEIEHVSLIGKDKEVFAKQRIGQGYFRDFLSARYHQCAISQCMVISLQFLKASHIKPWRVSSPEEKIDIDNGFLLCPNHDLLFDKGLISFDDDGRIIISDELQDIDKVYLNVSDNMTVTMFEGNRKYLEYHRKNEFKG